MRKGFTMIELIFVIVILGILAAVAIPKLTATRDDAQIARAASDVSTAVQDIASYYTAQGSFNGWDDMTNVQLNTGDGTTASTDGNVTAYYKVGSTNQCISFDLNTSTLTVGSNTATGPCEDAITLLTNKNILGAGGADQDHTFGGQGVSW